jgi:hypothetical protein
VEIARRNILPPMKCQFQQRITNKAELHVGRSWSNSSQQYYRYTAGREQGEVGNDYTGMRQFH